MKKVDETKRVDKTLVEQLYISEFEIKGRMNLLDIQPDMLKLLASHKVLIEDHIENIVASFYEKQTAIDEVALLIGDADTLKRLRDSQRTYILDLFGGHYDIIYVNNRLRIGLVHKRIGVKPKLYLAAVSTLKQILFAVLEAEIDDMTELSAVLSILDKLFYFDTTLIFDTYIDSLVNEVQSAKDNIEIYAQSLEKTVEERTKQLHEQARIDPLTNIYNQRAMFELLRKEILSAQRRQRPVSILYFDVDNFKAINDNLGHQNGDKVLKYVANSMVKRVREIDSSCRYGGDEFCVILPDCTIDKATLVAQSIIDDFSGKYDAYTLSIGIAQTGPTEFISGDELINIADKKMYLAKEEQGSQIRF